MIEQKNFEVNNCTEEELLYRCKSLHFSEENTLLIIQNLTSVLMYSLQQTGSTIKM